MIASRGEIMAQCETLADEVIVGECDLNRCREIREKIFNLALQRKPGSDSMITETRGVRVRGLNPIFSR